MRGITETKLAIAKELSIERYFQTLAQLIPQLPYEAMDRIVAIILQAAENGRTIFVFGNGGGAATASHIACDLNKGTITGDEDRQRLKVMALTDNVPLLTAWANDVGYEHIFSEQLKTFVQSGDVVLAISASGNSKNVICALQTARAAGATVIGMTGSEGGKVKPLCDICMIVPSDHMQIIEDLQHAVAHSVFLAVREKLRAREEQRPAARAAVSAD
jgi:D-sedoheptulose 7-phosphate isomerase